MPEFILDTGSPEHARAFNALDSFTQGYIEALFFTDEEQLCEQDDRDMPSVIVNLATMESRFDGGESFGFADLAPETLARIVADCAAFRDGLPRDGSGRTWIDLANDYAPNGYDDAQAGRDFWFSRNGHGVGFWDRGLGAIGDKLHKAAQAFSQLDSYVGDDGCVYLG